MNKGVFIALIFGYVLVFNFLVLNAVNKNGAISNPLTGNFVALDANPGTDTRVLMPLLLFNAAIIGSFTYSYYNFNRKSSEKSSKGKRRK